MLPVMGIWDLPAVLAPTVADCARVYEVMAGRELPAPSARRPRLGLLSDLLEAADPAVAAACERRVAALAGEADVRRVELGFDARGFGVLLAHEFERLWGKEVDRAPDRFPAVAREMVASARRHSSERVERAAGELMTARARARRRFRDLDALISPTVPVPAPARDRENVAESTRFTRLFSALGWPALSVPAGEVDGAPVAIQVSGAPLKFAAVVAAAARLDAPRPPDGSAPGGGGERSQAGFERSRGVDRPAGLTRERRTG